MTIFNSHTRLPGAQCPRRAGVGSGISDVRGQCSGHMCHTRRSAFRCDCAGVLLTMLTCLRTIPRPGYSHRAFACQDLLSNLERVKMLKCALKCATSVIPTDALELSYCGTRSFLDLLKNQSSTIYSAAKQALP